MIFFGKKASVLRTEQMFGLTCPACSASNSIHGAVVGNYGHLYWIPTFPMGRTVVAQCGNCRKTFDDKEMSPAMYQAISPMLNEVKSPLRHYTGLMIIGGLIALGAFVSINNDKENREYVAAPAVGDVYEIKISSDEYTTQKVTVVTGDSVFCAQNQYISDKITGLRSIDKDKNYLDVSIGYSLGDLKQMLADKKLIDVKR